VLQIYLGFFIGDKNMPNNKDRICIIGAGPAGLSCATYLEKKGYTNYTIYEKLNKVGGKC